MSNHLMVARSLRVAIIRIAAILLGLLVVLAAPAAAMSSMSLADLIHDHTYDGHHDTAVLTCAPSVRGPPTVDRHFHATTDASDRCSSGTSARCGRAASPTGCTYDDLAGAVQIVVPTATAWEVTPDARPTSARATRSGVAAKTGDDLTRVGRWMPEDELADMRRTGLVQERSGGRTFVTNPSDPAAYPAGKGVFAEFNVPTKSLFPAGKREWSVIPGPNVTTTRFGQPPSQMPPATCIVVVCRR